MTGDQNLILMGNSWKCDGRNSEKTDVAMSQKCRQPLELRKDIERGFSNIFSKEYHPNYIHLDGPQ